MIWKEEPVPSAPDVRGIAVALPSSLPPTIWASLFERLDAPFLVPVHAADLVENVEPAGAPATLRSPSTETFPFSYAQSIRDLGRKVDAYASMLTEESPVPAALERDLLYAGSAAYVADPADGQQWLDAVSAATQSAFDSVEPQVNKTFTFTSARARSRSSWATRGRSPCGSPLRCNRHSSDSPTAPARRWSWRARTRSMTFRVVAKAAGQNPIAVVVTAPSGAVIGSPQTIVVRSTAVNRIALLVTLAAAAVLALLYLRRWLRRTKTPS